MTMYYNLQLANRSGWNESKAKEVYGVITEKNSDKIVCYVPNQHQASIVLSALNHAKEQNPF